MATDFCTVVKYIATSRRHVEPRLHWVALSGDPPGMLHGEAVVQIWTDLTGVALLGA
jgi:hypothetical protein